MSVWEISIHKNYWLPINHSVEMKDDNIEEWTRRMIASVRYHKMHDMRTIDTRVVVNQTYRTYDSFGDKSINKNYWFPMNEYRGISCKAWQPSTITRWSCLRIWIWWNIFVSDYITIDLTFRLIPMNIT